MGGPWRSSTGTREHALRPKLAAHVRDTSQSGTWENSHSATVWRHGHSMAAEATAGAGRLSEAADQLSRGTRTDRCRSIMSSRPSWGQVHDDRQRLTPWPGGRALERSEIRSSLRAAQRGSPQPTNDERGQGVQDHRADALRHARSEADRRSVVETLQPSSKRTAMEIRERRRIERDRHRSVICLQAGR